MTYTRVCTGLVLLAALSAVGCACNKQQCHSTSLYPAVGGAPPCGAQPVPYGGAYPAPLPSGPAYGAPPDVPGPIR